MMHKPVIGITSRTLPIRGASQMRPAETMLRVFAEALEQVGGLPFLIPNSDDPATAGDYLHRIDGLLLSGGDDPTPQLFGEEPHPRIEVVDGRRDRFEMELVRDAHARDMPVLGVCRGIQMLNIALGGDIYQDIASQTDSTVSHVQSTLDDSAWHTVDVKEGTLLHRLLRAGGVKVNSFHHQACRRPGEGLKTSATCRGDGLIEALEDPSRAFFLGVQWHPEISAGCGDEASQRLMAAFVQAAGTGGRPSSKRRNRAVSRG